MKSYFALGTQNGIFHWDKRINFSVKFSVHFIVLSAFQGNLEDSIHRVLNSKKLTDQNFRVDSQVGKRQKNPR